MDVVLGERLKKMKGEFFPVKGFFSQLRDGLFKFNGVQSDPRPGEKGAPTHCLVANVVASRVQNVAGVAQRQGDSNIHRHRKSADLGQRREITKRWVFCHSVRKGDRLVVQMDSSSDSAF